MAELQGDHQRAQQTVDATDSEDEGKEGAEVD
jgi:hypothetical protein